MVGSRHAVLIHERPAAANLGRAHRRAAPLPLLLLLLQQERHGRGEGGHERHAPPTNRCKITRCVPLGCPRQERLALSLQHPFHEILARVGLRFWLRRLVVFLWLVCVAFRVSAARCSERDRWRAKRRRLSGAVCGGWTVIGARGCEAPQWAYGAPHGGAGSALHERAERIPRNGRSINFEALWHVSRR